MSDPNERDGRSPTTASDATSQVDEAMDWVIRMAEPDADWDAFTAWLEQDPARAERYDRAAAALHDAETHVAVVPLEREVRQPLVAEAPGIPRTRSMRWISGALAAALVGAVGMGVWTQAPRPYAVETAAGEQRSVLLGDGSSVLISGASKVRLDQHDARVATVERGEVLFHVRHDAGRPFTVNVGDLQLVDLGTVFDVKTEGGRTRVAVAEGAVMVDPDGAAMRLDAGQAMLAEDSTIERLVVDREDVGGWRYGRLVYDGAPLAEVASDLSRQLGRPITATRTISQRVFRGTIDVRSVSGRPALLGTLLDVQVRAVGVGWILEPRRR